MTTLFAITTILAAFLALMLGARLTYVERMRDRYHDMWEAVVRDRNAEDSLIFEFANRDLMPKWEKVYPHVRNMPAARKYSEWATFCANYPSRTAMEKQLGKVEGTK